MLKKQRSLKSNMLMNELLMTQVTALNIAFSDYRVSSNYMVSKNGSGQNQTLDDNERVSIINIYTAYMREATKTFHLLVMVAEKNQAVKKDLDEIKPMFDAIKNEFNPIMDKAEQFVLQCNIEAAKILPKNAFVSPNDSF
jgi:hypothetical protein